MRDTGTPGFEIVGRALPSVRKAPWDFQVREEGQRAEGWEAGGSGAGVIQKRRHWTRLRLCVASGDRDKEHLTPPEPGEK